MFLFSSIENFILWQKLNMPAQFDYVEMKENYNIQDTRENQESKDTAEKIPIIVSSHYISIQYYISNK